MTATTSEQGALAEDLERVAAAARDSLTDEMVSRLAGTAADAMDIIDRVNRSGLSDAIPALAEMVNNGDLDRLAKVARLYASAEDALTDEMVARLADTMAEGMSLLDRLSRGGAGRLVEMMARLESSGALERIAQSIPRLLERLEMLEGMLSALDRASVADATAPRSAGGFGGLWSLLRDPDNQDALRFLIGLGREMRAGAQRR
jgi:uncharacterized protein YjgD (DUF1641 family)